MSHYPLDQDSTLCQQSPLNLYSEGLWSANVAGFHFLIAEHQEQLPASWSLVYFREKVGPYLWQANLFWMQLLMLFKMLNQFF